MELQFNKTVIPCLKTVAREVQNQEQTQEVRLTDGMPDIGKVLASWGQLLIRGKEWRSGGMSVTGGVMVWILYAPEDGTDPKCVETWMPFQMKWDFPDAERDGAICLLPLLRGVDARSTSARKLMVRAGVSILGEAMTPGDVEIYAPGELPEDIQILKNTYPVLIPKEAGEKAFLIDEVISLPASLPPLEKLIRYEVCPQLSEQKVVGDKLVFRGIANLHILYRGADERLHSWDFEMPFSQFAELDREYDTDAVARVCLAVTSLELERGEEENLNWKTGIIGQYVVYDRPMIELAEDAYSPNRSVVPQITGLTLPSVLDIQSQTLQAEQSMEFEGINVVDAGFNPEHPRVYREGDRVTAELGGMFQALGYNDGGEVYIATNRWEDSWNISASQNARIEIAVQAVGKTQASISGGSVAMQASLPMDITTVSQQGIPMVTGLEVGEATQPDPNRPSLILRRAGSDRLWDIAKQTGSTVTAIQSANGIQQEPSGDQMLLIPIS